MAWTKVKAHPTYAVPQTLRIADYNPAESPSGRLCGDPDAIRTLCGDEIHIVALTSKDKVPYIYETNINTSNQKKVIVNFAPSTQEEIKARLKKLN